MLTFDPSTNFGKRKSIKVVYIELEPFVRHLNPPLSGADVDVWEILEQRLGMRVRPVRADNYRAMFQMVRVLKLVFATKPAYKAPTRQEVGIRRYVDTYVRKERQQGFASLPSFFLQMATGSYEMAASHGYLLLHRYRIGLDVTAEGERVLLLATRHPATVDSFHTILYPFRTATWAAVAASLATMAALLSWVPWWVSKYQEGSFIQY